LTSEVGFGGICFNASAFVWFPFIYSVGTGLIIGLIYFGSAAKWWDLPPESKSISVVGFIQFWFGCQFVFDFLEFLV
jgi:hypothetical protein